MKKYRRRGRLELTVHVAHSFAEAEEWDRKFWRAAGLQKRFEAAWQMIGEYDKMRGGRGHKQRLQRAVRNIERL